MFYYRHFVNCVSKNDVAVFPELSTNCVSCNSTCTMENDFSGKIFTEMCFSFPRHGPYCQCAKWSNDWPLEMVFLDDEEDEVSDYVLNY